MNVSAVNCTPIKPQSFGSGDTVRGIDFGSEEAAMGAQRVLDLSRELNDSFKKEGSEENDKKNPVATAVSVAGACLSMFALGRVAGKGAMALVNKIPASAKENAAEFVKKQTSKIKAPKITIKNEKAAQFVSNAYKQVASFAAKCKANPENVAGGIAALTLAPAIITADGNQDGVADIAQKNINAYSSALKSAEIFADMFESIA